MSVDRSSPNPPATGGSAAPAEGLELFHPIVQDWFRRRYGRPSPPQRAAWPVIARGEHTLLLAPTGSGKTLAAFFVFLDRLFRRMWEPPGPGASEGRPVETGVHLLYVSPLKALDNDIHRNLEEPLEGIAALARAQGLPAQAPTRAVRTGDTPPSARRAMVRRPPQILITTPESLLRLLLAPRAPEMLKTVRAVIVDEIHQLAGSKRGGPAGPHPGVAGSLGRSLHPTGRPFGHPAAPGADRRLLGWGPARHHRGCWAAGRGGLRKGAGSPGGGAGGSLPPVPRGPGPAPHLAGAGGAHRGADPEPPLHHRLRPEPGPGGAAHPGAERAGGRAPGPEPPREPLPGGPGAGGGRSQGGPPPGPGGHQHPRAGDRRGGGGSGHPGGVAQERRRHPPAGGPGGPPPHPDLQGTNPGQDPPGFGGGGGRRPGGPGGGGGGDPGPRELPRRPGPAGGRHGCRRPRGGLGGRAPLPPHPPGLPLPAPEPGCLPLGAEASRRRLQPPRAGPAQAPDRVESDRRADRGAPRHPYGGGIRWAGAGRRASRWASSWRPSPGGWKGRLTCRGRRRNGQPSPGSRSTTPPTSRRPASWWPWPGGSGRPQASSPPTSAFSWSFSPTRWATGGRSSTRLSAPGSTGPGSSPSRPGPGRFWACRWRGWWPTRASSSGSPAGVRRPWPWRTSTSSPTWRPSSARRRRAARSLPSSSATPPPGPSSFPAPPPSAAGPCGSSGSGRATSWRPSAPSPTSPWWWRLCGSSG